MSLPHDLFPLLDPRARIRLLRACRYPPEEAVDALLEWARGTDPNVGIVQALALFEVTEAPLPIGNSPPPWTPLGITIRPVEQRLHVTVHFGPWSPAPCRLCHEGVERGGRARWCLLFDDPCCMHCLGSLLMCLVPNRRLHAAHPCATVEGQVYGTLIFS